MNSNESLVFQFKISLKCIKPKIWRRILVPSSYNFRQLHYAIQDSMGWKSGIRDYHLHGYRMRDPLTKRMIDIGMPREDFDKTKDILEKDAKIADYFKDVKTKAVYTYDYGDDWDHDVVLEKVIPLVKGLIYPSCINGSRACPPEDCGGYDGYNEHVNIVKNPNHPEYKEHCEWVKRQNAKLDPEEFDPATVKFNFGDNSFLQDSVVVTSNST